jgi:hypothetical protein
MDATKMRLQHFLIFALVCLPHFSRQQQQQPLLLRQGAVRGVS